MSNSQDTTIWAALFHMGVNMWCDRVPPSWGPYKGKDLELVGTSDQLRFDEHVWRTLTARMVEVGMNMVLIDLGEALIYPSHPELAVKGSWSVERFRAELTRLRAMGLEPIPKLNFSAGHDIWLKDYSRMLSTPTYYKVCADLIRDVDAIFNHPRFFHIGYDEETAGHQIKYNYCAVRQGELWWHDFLFFVNTVEKTGMRPWMWSDFAWNHDEFYARCPKSVVQSNWYYAPEFDTQKLKGLALKRVQTYDALDKAGFDQIPTGSNWSYDTNFGNTVTYCQVHCSPKRLKGYMMAPWFFTLPGWQQKNLEAIDQVGAARAKVSRA